MNEIEEFNADMARENMGSAPPSKELAEMIEHIKKASKEGAMNMALFKYLDTRTVRSLEKLGFKITQPRNLIDDGVKHLVSWAEPNEKSQAEKDAEVLRGVMLEYLEALDYTKMFSDDSKKETPPTKSKFQIRLEEMAKEKGIKINQDEN